MVSMSFLLWLKVDWQKRQEESSTSFLLLFPLFLSFFKLVLFLGAFSPGTKALLLLELIKLDCVIEGLFFVFVLKLIIGNWNIVFNSKGLHS